MRSRIVPGVLRALVCAFVSATVIFDLVITVMIAIRPGFPLDVGLIRTVGRAGLAVTVPPAVVGLVGLAWLRRRRALGAALVATYSGFCAAVFLGALPRVWNAPRSFCLQGLNFCILSPWVSRLTAVGIAAPFVLTAWWSVRQAKRREPGPAKNGRQVRT